jgi:hypothetical protein
MSHQTPTPREISSHLHIHTSTRRLSSAMTVLACLIVLVVALLGPAQTLAQTHKASCSSAATHAKAAHSARACGRSLHKGKNHRHKRHSKHAPAKPHQQGIPATLPAAYCEDGNTPVKSSEGSFSCTDGSEPECEDGAEPTRSSNGRSLVCAILSEEAEEEAEAGESECEEADGPFCAVAAIPGSDEESCEVSSSDSSSFTCEAES